jgi:23S rRNA (uracil1939-C5)-methyltransferase
MGRKNKELLENVVIEKVAAEGKSMAHVNGKVLFVPFSVPGDVVNVQLRSKRKGFMEGYVTDIIKPSSLRTEPFCSHFGVCGGCKWQMLPYPEQLKSKQNQVEDQLSRIGKFNLPNISEILGSDKTKYYRNKLEYTFSSRRWIENVDDLGILSEKEKMGAGFHISGMYDKVLDIDTCYLQREPSNAIRLFVKEYAIEKGIDFYDIKAHTGFLRNLIVRTSTTGEVMVIVVISCEEPDIYNPLLEALKVRFPEITSLNWIVNNKKNDSINDLDVYLYSGKPHMNEVMEDLEFRIGPKSFYQTNSEQAYRLYSIVRDFAGLTGNEVLYDLYTGAGTIALFLSRYCKSVVGIEYVEEAVVDARQNALLNGIDNVTFHSGDMKDVLNKDFVEQHGRPDVIVLDPPRAGIHPDVAEAVSKTAPDKIIYVSCNSATQARDIGLMINNYQISSVQPVDMFPHTHHLENVVLMDKINK